MKNGKVSITCKMQKKELRNYTNRKVDEKRWFFDDDEEDKEKKIRWKISFNFFWHLYKVYIIYERRKKIMNETYALPFFVK